MIKKTGDRKSRWIVPLNQNFLFSLSAFAGPYHLIATKTSKHIKKCICKYILKIFMAEIADTSSGQSF